MESLAATLNRLKGICMIIMIKPTESEQNLKLLEDFLPRVPDEIITQHQSQIIASLIPFLQTKPSFTLSESHWIQVINTLSVILSRITISSLGLFVNLFSFLMSHIYDGSEKELMKSISEEYMLSVIQCTTTLFKCLDNSLLSSIYQRSHSAKICPYLYICLAIVEKEQLRKLKIAAMESIMMVCRVNTEHFIEDTDIRKQVADTLMFALPQLSVKLKNVATGDFKTGHKVILIGLKTWGRCIALFMEDYNPLSNKLNINDPNIQEIVVKFMLNLSNNETSKSSGILLPKLTDETQLKDYLQQTKRTELWYKETDEQLMRLINFLTKLTSHPNEEVRSELFKTGVLIIERCRLTLPKSIYKICDILITLSSDSNDDIAKESKAFIDNLNLYYNDCFLRGIENNLQQIIKNNILALPLVFNGVDEYKQLQLLNSIMGYINFYKTHNEMFLHTILRDLLSNLLAVCPLDLPDFRLFEEYVPENFLDEQNVDKRTPWINLRFQDNLVENMFIKIIKSFSQSTFASSTGYYLMELIRQDSEKRIKATFLLNTLLNSNIEEPLLTNVIDLYMELDFLELPLYIKNEEKSHSAAEIRKNIILICLQTEGIGNAALCLGTRFLDKHLLMTLYEILQRAGSYNPLIRLSGLQAINKIAEACGHSNVTELISNYPDFFSYHVVKRICRLECNESVLSVVCAVINLSTMDVLPSISEIMDNIIMQSCDKFNAQLATSYLYVFNVFIKRLFTWMNIEVKEEPRKTKLEKEAECESFQVSGILPDSGDYSDEAVMGSTTAEELFKEDMDKYMKDKESRENEKNEEDDFELEDCQEYKKPELPLHIKITVSILKRSLNFLPSKLKERKILVLNILINGIELLRDWEDELLPVVHLIWSPLVNRFSDAEEPVIVNLTFQLLTVLAKLSKDFIRSRTVKDVLPHLQKRLINLAKESYLKDKGSAYRYSQDFKLQLEILENLANVVVNLDLGDAQIDQAIQSVIPYLSNKQPVPLQKSCIKFFSILIYYDKKLMKSKIDEIEKFCIENAEHTKNVKVIRDLYIEE